MDARDTQRQSVEDGELGISIELDGDGACVLQLFGDADYASADTLSAQIREAEELGRPVFVDLSGLDFIDSSVIGVLVRAAERSRANGRGLRLLRGPAPVDRVFEISGLLEKLPFAD